jgi:uncharacterized protein YndB with AHSA1/START domain
MTTTDFTTTITFDQSMAKVFDAINNVRSWWHGEVEGSTNKLGDEFSYHMKHFHFSQQKVVELIPNQKIVWLVTDSNLSFTQKKNEWTGTKIIFEIWEADNKTQLRFTHEGLNNSFECFDNCSNGWTMLIHESLPSLINTGKGLEVFG